MEREGRNERAVGASEPEIATRGEVERSGEVGPFDEDGLPVPAAWIAVPEDDPLLRAVCDAPLTG